MNIHQNPYTIYQIKKLYAIKRAQYRKAALQACIAALTLEGAEHTEESNHE